MANFPVSWFAKIGDKLKMSKLRKATKKITAVAAATAMVASAAFGASLGSYPSNFVKNDKFNGQIVVGSAADAMDSTNAQAIIADLAKEFSGESSKVKISYKKAGTGGEELPVMKSNTDVNFGESITDAFEKQLDDGDSSLLADGELKKEDYKQYFVLENVDGKFERAYESNVDNMKEQKVGVYFDDEAVFAEYKFELDNAVADHDDSTNKIVGEKIQIMGVEYVVSEWKSTSVKLIGGSNKVSLGEGETTTVTINGKEYEVSVSSVSSDKVLLTVNGQSDSIDKFDTEEVAGIKIAVTDLVDSSRDSVKGYAEIVVGGQEVQIVADGEVQIDDEDVSEVFENYLVESAITLDGGDVKSFTITYKVNDNTFLEEGYSLKDVLFQAFTFSLDDVTSPDTAAFKFEGNSNDVDMTLMTKGGEELKLTELVTITDAGTIGTVDVGEVQLNGADIGDTFLTNAYVDAQVASAVAPADVTGGANYVVGSVTFAISGTNDSITVKVGDDTLASGLGDDDKIVYGGKVYNIDDATLVSFDMDAIVDAAGIEFDKRSEGMRFITGDADEPILFEVKSYSKSNEELTLDKLSDRGSDEVVKIGTFEDKVEAPANSVKEAANGVYFTSATPAFKNLRLENNLIMSLENVVSGTYTIDFSYHTDFDSDEGTEADEIFKLQLGLDSDSDITIVPTAGAAGGWTGLLTDTSVNKVDKDSDLRLATSRYGTTVKWDTDNKDLVTVVVPEEQVVAEVSYVAGGESAETMTMTVDADMVESTKADLKADKYTIVGTEDVASTKVEFDVKAVTLDTEVSGMDNMIVVGGPAVNAVARELMGIEAYTIDQAGVAMGEGIVKYFADANSVLVYGYSAADTTAAVAELNNGGLSGNEHPVK